MIDIEVPAVDTIADMFRVDFTDAEAGFFFSYVLCNDATLEIYRCCKERDDECASVRTLKYSESSSFLVSTTVFLSPNIECSSSIDQSPLPAVPPRTQRTYVMSNTYMSHVGCGATYFTGWNFSWALKPSPLKPSLHSRNLNIFNLWTTKRALSDNNY